MPHIIFLSNDTAYISLLTKLTHTFNLQMKHSISAADSPKSQNIPSQYMKIDVEQIEFLILSVIRPVDQKLFDLQSPSWVDGSVFIFMDFAVLNQINQPKGFIECSKSSL